MTLLLNVRLHLEILIFLSNRRSLRVILTALYKNDPVSFSFYSKYYKENHKITISNDDASTRSKMLSDLDLSDNVLNVEIGTNFLLEIRLQTEKKKVPIVIPIRSCSVQNIKHIETPTKTFLLTRRLQGIRSTNVRMFVMYKKQKPMFRISLRFQHFQSR